MTKPPFIVWFRKDLRLEDNPAFKEAAESGHPVIPLYIHTFEGEEAAPGAAGCWWLHHSLLCFTRELKEMGLNLIIRHGNSLESLLSVIEESGAKTVVWNRRYEPAFIERDGAIKSLLRQKEIKAQSFNASLLYEPWLCMNKQGKPFQVFTPFWKSCLASRLPEKPLGKPTAAIPFTGKINSETILSLDLLPKIPWDIGLEQTWKPGVKGAKENLHFALDEVIAHYGERRDFPALRGTSRLSPYLHWGELSPRMIWHAVVEKFKDDPKSEPFLRQLGWREFGYHLLYHFPHTPSKPLRDSFLRFRWDKNPEKLKAWQRGVTGYPIVDAGMRELWATGWMHNRVRMIVGSFLVKDLLISWTEGAAWFWNTLVDADLANNTLGWQWVGGCGADAAPYFRIFNPILQGEKFDPKGEYVRKWIPELKELPDCLIHQPWNAPESVLRRAGIELGKSYPKPIVDHSVAKDLALKAFSELKE